MGASEGSLAAKPAEDLERRAVVWSAWLHPEGSALNIPGQQLDWPPEKRCCGQDGSRGVVRCIAA
jgi:hypothetical protein